MMWFIERGVHDEALEALTAANLERMIALAAEVGVRVGLLTSPQFGEMHPTNDLVRRVAARHPEVLLIDAAETLAQRFLDPAMDLQRA